MLDTSQMMQLGTMALGLAGIYSQLRSSQAVIGAKLDGVADRLTRIEGQGTTHAGEIADLRIRVSTLGVRVTSLEQSARAVALRRPRIALVDLAALTDWHRADDVAEAIAVCEDPQCPCEVRYSARLTPEAEARLLWGLDALWEPVRA